MAKKPVSYLGGAVLIGTAIGAVVGLLAAPLSGKEMRGMLRRRAIDAGKEIPVRLKDVPSRLRDVPARGRQVLADLPDRGRRTLSRLPGWARTRRRADQPIDTTATEVRGEQEDVTAHDATRQPPAPGDGASPPARDDSAEPPAGGPTERA